MTFNPSKCNIIHGTRKLEPLGHVYTLKGIPLEAVDSATYLSVDVTKDLTWNKQVHKAATKGNRALGFIKRNIKTKSGVKKELADKALVWPTLEYASTVWSPHLKKLKTEVEKVQRRAARYVTHRYAPLDSPTEMLQTLKWESLEQRRLKARGVMGYRVVHGRVGISSEQLVSSTSSTRGHDMRYQTIYGRTDYNKKTFFPSLIPCGIGSQVKSSPRPAWKTSKANWPISTSNHQSSSLSLFVFNTILFYLFCHPFAFL